MTIDDKIRGEKLQKISALSSGKVDEYDYLMGE